MSWFSFQVWKNFKITFHRSVAMSPEPQELRGVCSDRVKLKKLVVLDVSHLMTVVLVDKGKWFRINQSINQAITKPLEVLYCVEHKGEQLTERFGYEIHA